VAAGGENSGGPLVSEVAVHTCPTGDHVVVTLAGEIDVATADAVTEAFTDATSREGAGGYVCCDLSAVTFLDSTGLTALLTARRACEDRGIEMVLVGAAGSVRRVLALSRVDSLFRQFPSLDEFESAVGAGG
jgi:anti-sigma B factor antagonist